MKSGDIGSYIQKLFENNILVAVSAAGAALYQFFFPETQYLYGAGAVLLMMVLDLLTKLYALGRQAGGWRTALRAKKINSLSFFRGTMDKLVVFGVMLIICGCAYRLTLFSAIAVWFTQAVFILMFLRDALSIVENLRDAGIQGMGVFEKVIRKKMDDYIESGDSAGAASEASADSDEPI